MFSTLKERTRATATKVSERVLLLKAEVILASLGIKIEEKDIDEGVLLFEMENGSTALLAINSSYAGHRIETNVVFDAEAGSLKMLSDIADVSFAHRCAITGYTGIQEDKLQVTLCYHVGTQLNRESLSTGLSYVSQCLESLTMMIRGKLDSLNSVILDLSMFEHIDISLFNPKVMGERKEFIYQTWDRYAQAAAIINPEEPTLASIEASIPEIMACRDFEEKNKALLAEVGDTVLKELKVHRHLMDTSEYMN